MTREMRPPDRGSSSAWDPLDPVVEGDRYWLSAELLRAIWNRARADSTDAVGRRNDEQARQLFHRLAAQFEARSEAGVGVGKLTQVGLAADGASRAPWTTSALMPRVPGRETLVEREAVESSGSSETPAAVQGGASAASWSRGFDDHHVPWASALVPAADRGAAMLFRRAASDDVIGQDHAAVAAALQQRGSGEPLPPELRRTMERELRVALAGVRIHTDEVAARAARVLGADAFTIGKDIFFANGRFAPDTRSGRKLLAHELAHVTQVVHGNVQQAGDGLRVSQPGEPLEREADAIAERVDQAATPPGPEHSDGAAASGMAPADLAPGLGRVALIQRQPAGPVYGPPAATGAGDDFDMFLLQFTALESAAAAEGYGFNDLITAFRKIFYDSASAAKTYAGAVVGGGVWNILIPGAAGTKLPASWTTGPLAGAADYVRKHQVLSIAGKQVDIGHLLAGADAAKHPTSLSLAAGMVRLRSNQEATTFVGDLGTVVTEYIHGSKASFRDTAMVRSPLLDSYYDGANAMASAEDMAGNADSYALTLDSTKTLSQNLKDYYAATSGGGVNKRYTRFASAIGLGTLVSGAFTGNTASWRDAMVDQVFNSALAYAGGKGWKGDVTNVLADPGPGIFAPTFWEMYFNISGWVVDIFVNRMIAAVAKE